MYKIIGKLTPEKFVKCDFLLNFGVSIQSKKLLTSAVFDARSYDQFKENLEQIPLKEALIIHKYFTFANKKIKVIMYNEYMSEASEDLLKELTDKDEEKQQKQISINKKKPEAHKIVVADKKTDNLKYEFKKRMKDLNKDEDFPDLLGGGKPAAEVQKSPSPDKSTKADEEQKTDYKKLEETLKTGETVVIMKKKAQNKNKQNKQGNNKGKGTKKLVMTGNEFPTLGGK